MTTPAQDAPLVFPSVAFRPVRLLAICCALTALAVGLAAMAGHVMFGVFFGVGLLLGLTNAVLVQRSVASITAGDHPLKRAMALNSATRLLVISAIGLTVAFVEWHEGEEGGKQSNPPNEARLLIIDVPSGKVISATDLEKLRVAASQPE